MAQQMSPGRETLVVVLWGGVQRRSDAHEAKLMKPDLQFLQDVIIVYPPESDDRDLGSLLGKPWPRLPLMAHTSKKEPALLTL